jgi:hypothetical protein
MFARWKITHLVRRLKSKFMSKFHSCEQNCWVWCEGKHPSWEDWIWMQKYCSISESKSSWGQNRLDYLQLLGNSSNACSLAPRISGHYSASQDNYAKFPLSSVFLVAHCCSSLGRCSKCCEKKIFLLLKLDK